MSLKTQLTLLGLTLIQLAVKSTQNADAELKPYGEVVKDLLAQSLERIDAETQERRKRAVDDGYSYMQPQSHTVAATPGVKARARATRGLIEAMRSYRTQWQQIHGSTDDRQFMDEVRRQMNPLVPADIPIVSVTIRGDEDPGYSHSNYTCFLINRNCTGAENYRYRFFDGSCNNLHQGRENWGARERALKRVAPPAYADGFYAPRVSSTSHPLPSSRAVTLKLQELSNIADNDFAARESSTGTLHRMQVGQFLTHDNGGTILHDVFEIPCPCGTPTNDLCHNIPTEPGNPFGPCYPITRSVPVLNDDCDITKIEQLNSLTAYIDASQVYGTDIARANLLRDFTSPAVFGREHGRMLVEQNPSFTAEDEQVPLQCPAGVPRSGTCQYLTGDLRGNTHSGLISMHTVWVRLHNFLEENIYQHNTHLNSEQLFQEARRLCIAIWQNIVYNEYLLPLLGPTAFGQYGLNDASAYDDSIDPQISNEFGTAAFRVGHSEIPDLFHMIDYLKTREEVRFVANTWFNTTIMLDTPFDDLDMSPVDALMIGFAEKPAQNFDSYFSASVRQHFIAPNVNTPGFDLAARNLQRGREHGLAGYGSALEACGMNVSAEYLDSSIRQQILEFYGSTGPSDVQDTLYTMDLYAGGLLESKTSDGEIGPTFTCLIARQFGEAKRGDRFYFTHPGSGFTTAQVDNIKPYCLSSVLCDALGDDVREMQELALLKPWPGRMNANKNARLNIVYGDRTNRVKKCNKLPKIDFSLFATPDPLPDTVPYA